VFVPSKPFQLSVMFAGKNGTYLSSAPLLVRLLALPANITVGLKGLQGTNTLAYWER
jgi:hypothetical protein